MSHGKKPDEGKKNEPVHKLTAWTGSRIEVAIWKHENGDRVNYSVTTGRSYKIEEEGKKPRYENSDFMQERDLLALSELLRQAWIWIGEQGK